MFVGTTIPDALKDGIEEFAREQSIDGNPLPVRVLAGRFRVTTPGEWTNEQAEANNVDKEFANEHGLTIVDWGSASPQYPREWNNLTALVYDDNQERELNVRDVIVPQEGSTRRALPYEVGNIEDHFELAEIGERTIWYFINLQHVPDPDKLELETFLYEPAKRSLDPDLMENFRRELEERSATAFADLMAADPTARYESQQERVREMERQLQSFQQQETQVVMQLTTAQKELDAIMATANVDPDHWKEQWRRMSKHPLIVPGTLQMNERTVSYDTVELPLVNPDTNDEVVLGALRISIQLGNQAIKIENLTNRRRNRDHPQVDNGNPCWGGYHSEVMDLMQRHEIAGLVEWLFGYLQTYNPQDEWGRFAQYWYENPAEPSSSNTEAVAA